MLTTKANECSPTGSEIFSNYWPNGCNQEAKQNTTIAVNRLKPFINFGEFTFSTNLGCKQ